MRAEIRMQNIIHILLCAYEIVTKKKKLYIGTEQGKIILSFWGVREGHGEPESKTQRKICT